MTNDEGALVSRLLQQRCDSATEATLRDGRRLIVHNVAWGRDLGLPFDHFTTNISPPPGFPHTLDFFRADEVVRLVAVETGTVIFEALG
jgi:hypothetical protein